MHWDLLLPNSSKLIELITEHSDHFLFHWWATFSVSFMASVLALSGAIVLSAISFCFKPIRIIMSPLVAVSQSFPLQAVAPILLILLGSGFSTKTTIAFLIAFFPIYSACLTALFTTPKNLMNLLFVCRSPLLRGIWHVRLPSALPAIISSAKVGFTLAVLGAVVAEFIHPDEGLGYLLLIAQSSYNIEVIYICIGLLMFQGVIIYQGLSFFESYIMRTRGE